MKKSSFFLLLIFCITFSTLSIDFKIGTGTFLIGGATAFAKTSCELLEEKIRDGINLSRTELNRLNSCVAAAGSNKIAGAVLAFTDPIDTLLYGILVLMGWLANIAAIIFNATVDPKTFQNIFVDNKPILQDMWFVVRDFLNIFFILILLFSAFSTIFQVEKFHLKQILLTLILMALLVNFSWPITLVIIDAGNVMMYFFLNNIFSDFENGATIFAKISAKSSIAGFIIPDTLVEAIQKKNPATSLIMAIIFMFLLAITLLTIAGIFLIRLVMFVLLIIFSPIAFVAAILPSTRQFSNMWWDNILKWTFIGPIMVFMLSVSIKFMSTFQTALRGDSTITIYKDAVAQTSKSYLADLFTDATIAFAAIAVLWAGIIAANKMGGAAAGFVTSRASSAAKWGGKMAGKGGWKSTKFAGRVADTATGNVASGTARAIKQRYKQSVDNREAIKDQRAASIGSRIGVKGAVEKDMQKRAGDYEKNHATVSELKELSKNGDVAAALALAKKGELEQIDAKVKAKMEANEGVSALLNGEIKKKRIDLVVDYEVNSEHKIKKKIESEAEKGRVVNEARAKALIRKDTLGKLDAETFAKQDLSKIKDSSHGARILRQYTKFRPAAKNEIDKRMSGGNAEVLRDAGIV